MTLKVMDAKIINGWAFQNAEATVLEPIRSFWSPLKGIPRGTRIRFTGEVFVTITTKKITHQGNIKVGVKADVGIKWGKHLKGTDWISSRALKNLRLEQSCSK